MPSCAQPFVTVFLCFFTRVVRLITSTMVKMSSSLSGSCLWYVLHSPAAPSTVWAKVLSLTDTPDQLHEVQCTGITELLNIKLSPILPDYPKVPLVLREVLDICNCGVWPYCFERSRSCCRTATFHEANPQCTASSATGIWQDSYSPHLSLCPGSSTEGKPIQNPILEAKKTQHCIFRNIRLGF